MKRIIFLLIILGCILFCGCAATADMEYGIDTDNNAYTRLRVDMKMGDLASDEKQIFMSSLQQIGSYYRDELGFEYDYDFFAEDEDNAYILLTRSVPADSFEEAFENLKAMLCDESITAFSEVSCELSDTEAHYAYRIKGRVELNKVLDNIYASGISKGTADHIAAALEGCSFSVTLSLPDNTRIYRLSLAEPTEISHEGKVFAVLGEPLDSSSVFALKSYGMIALLVFGTFTVLSLIGMTVGIICIKKGGGKVPPIQTAPVSPVNQIPRNGEISNDQEDQYPL